MHSDDMEDVSEARGGDIVAMFGVDCASGDTFTDGSVKYTMTSMNVPDPVMSLAITPTNREGSTNVSWLGANYQVWLRFRVCGRL